MSIYDQIMATTQHGYDTANQNAMAMAQMPTFADKFLAGLRGGEDAAYKRQMGMSQLDMNMAYKQAQAQKMRDDARLSEIQRRTGILGYISKELMPGKYNEVVSQVQAMGGDPAWVSQQQFVPGTETVEAQPVYPGASLAEGGEETASVVPTETPVEGTGWGTDAWLRNKAMTQSDQKAKEANKLKIQLASMKPDQMENFGKLIRFAETSGLGLDHPIIQAALAKYSHIQETPTVMAPVPAVRKDTGEPVFVTPGKQGGLTENPDFAPIPKGPGGARKPVDPTKLLGLIEEAKRIIPKSSSGVIGTYAQQGVSRGLGVSTETSQANTRLKALSGWMVANVPRMEGPQSDKDVAVYTDMAARVGDTTYPIGDRLAALDTIKTIMEKYKHLNTPEPISNTQPQTTDGTEKAFNMQDGSVKTFVRRNGKWVPK